MKFLMFFLTTFCCISTTCGQALYKIDIEEKILNSTLIIEGRVVEQQSFWNYNHTIIFTSNTVKVYKTFKGIVAADFVEVLTIGGIVDNTSLQASDVLTIQNGSTGVFFLFPNTINVLSPKTNELLFDVYSSSQGFYLYELNKGYAVAPFVTYTSILNNLYPELILKSGRMYQQNFASFSPIPGKPTASILSLPVIANFTETTIYAGALQNIANNILEIKGNNFGSSTTNAAILFSDANNGASLPTFIVNATDNLIISWTDTLIKTKVPTCAVTGTFAIKTSTGQLATSTNKLQIFSSILSENFNGITKQANLINQNTKGGYDVYISNNFAGNSIDLFNAAEKNSITNALNTWKESVGVNWVDSGATAMQNINNDNYNIITYDNANTGSTPMPSGVLAICYNFFYTCGGSFATQKTAFDIVVRNSNYSLGTANVVSQACSPSTAQLDLETILLHALGHALNLGHIHDGPQGVVPNINAAKIMHWASMPATRRTSLDASAYKAAFYNCNATTSNFGSCLYSQSMIQNSFIAVSNDDCPSNFSNIPTVAGTKINFDLVHATSNIASDPAYNNYSCSGLPTTIANTQFATIKTQNSGELNLQISNFLSYPNNANLCADKHIVISIFKVDACPTGQNFPAPIACRTFATNGIVTPISGLLPNTNYLLVANGNNNNKATFSLQLNGSVLPLQLILFSGEPLENCNKLYWEAATILSVNSIEIQRSFDGIIFETIGAITGSDVYKTKQSFIDKNANNKTIYYKLKIKNSNQSYEYSRTIIVARTQLNKPILYPNPAKNIVHINGLLQENNTISIKDINGKSIALFSNYRKNTIDVSSFANGIYMVIINNNNLLKLIKE
jgi:Secretion system C-terminal sorting domain